MDYVLSEHAKTAMRERNIKAEWVKATLAQPELSQPHEEDPELRYAFRRISEYGDRVLRIVYNETKNPTTIVTMYFDRTMKGKL